MTRREVLGAGLVAAGGLLAGGAVTRTGSSAPIEGAVVGASDALGHLLRGDRALPPPARTSRAAVVIVGAGIAGLAAARRLGRAGLRDLVLLELEPDPGGNTRRGASAVTPYPWGAHYLPLPPPEATEVRRLLLDLGVIERLEPGGRAVYDERHVCHAPQERLYLHGRWQDGLFPSTGATEEDLAHHAAFRELMERFRAWRDPSGRRAFAVPRLAGAPRAFAALDRQSMAELLSAHGLTSARLRWYVEYACRDDYGSGLDETSAWAGVHYFAAREADPEYGDAVLTWPEGNAWLAERMAAEVPGETRTRHLVVNVEPLAGGVAVDVYDATRDAAERLLAREVILACPVLVAARVYRPWRERPPAFAARFRYAPWLVANLHLDPLPAGAPGTPPAWDNVLYESDALGYVVATHQSLASHVPRTVWTYYRSFPGVDPAAARRELLATAWHATRDRILADLGRAHPDLASSVRRLDVMRYGHAMVRPEVGFVCGAALEAAAGALQGPVHLAHADLSGFSLFEEAYEWGVRAADRVLARLGRSGPR
jgi:choline dehydrogenase-like flavoprotein